MANTEWKNRIERKHTHDCIPWVDGWIHGFLTPHPEWKKRSHEHDTAIRNATLDEIQDHNDGRLKGIEILMTTPSEERCKSAQDVYLKEAYFELALVKHLLESLRTPTPQEKD